ncbi:MAG: helix-turn-helix domain-containing protein [Candidatus Contendobacter sp.]|nr:helix-turn-helix domain-containing protein [Candidatus Contendobacter sp.]MDG4556154.1 helix-turn-helix domain-containing protein [Candidatus Contendobacter sp.]
MTAKATSSIQVIARLSRLLDAIAAHDEPVSLKTLASAAGLHPSTAFRILASLIEHGLVERGVNGRYRLGAKLLCLGDRAHGQSSLQREIPPFAERPRNLAGEPARPVGREDDAGAPNAC